MRTVGKRSIFLYLIIFVFCAGMVFLAARVFLNGSSWASMPFNAHLYDDHDEQRRGSICDRNGTLLYSDEKGFADSSREALLHLLGDREGNISTGVFSLYSAELSGYNPLTGNAREGNLFKTKTRLTVSSQACERAYELLGDRSGAVFIYNYRTGEVLCSVSSPSFDPDHVPEDIETNSSFEGAYLDKTISETFTPGSIFKIITAACAIENLPNWKSWKTECIGETEIGDGCVTCLEHHGEIGIREGLMYSCNVVFSELAVELGGEKLAKTAEELGFNRSFLFENAHTAKSAFDVSNAKADELGWAGVGQYSNRVSPYHMAVLMGSIASGGETAQPYYVERISAAAELPLYTAEKRSAPLRIRETTAAELRTMLRQNVTDYYGEYLFPGLDAGAKTGTAEVGQDKDDTAWMVGFLESPETPYAFAVVVEEGGSGYRAAGSIASELLGILSEE